MPLIGGNFDPLLFTLLCFFGAYIPVFLEHDLITKEEQALAFRI